MEKFLLILRGIPGSGKSTLASLLTNKENVCTADDYHMVDGEYKWKPEHVAGAHSWCQSKAEGLMVNGKTPVIVANTSTTMKEMQPYYDMAEKHGYKVFSVIVENRHKGENTHGVPEETLIKMMKRFDIRL